MHWLSAKRLERVLVEATDREPDTELIDRPNWVQIRTPSSRLVSHNAVLLARLAPHEVRARVEEVVAEHAARGAGFRWVVGPSSEPADLAEQVLASGAERLGESVGMAMTIPEDDLTLDMPGLAVEPLRVDNLDEFASLNRLAWERDDAFEARMRYLANKALGEPTNRRSWIAYLDGEPVAASSLRLLPDLGYLQGCAVVPAHRRRGIYRALLRHRLHYLREQGFRYAAVWAAASGSAITCRSLGFQTICSAEFFEWAPAT
jgi:ribosomal protein S18 acetylase RimI-like enzyme